MKKGIYLLSNDKVFHQAVALLNSIETNYDRNIPICIIPYDKNIDLLKKEVAKRSQIFFFEDDKSIEKWETFIKSFQEIYLNYPQEGIQKKRTETINMHRKYCAFDGVFDKFIYIDTDTLVFRPLEHIFNKLNKYDFVAHDFQRKTDIRTGTVSYFFEVFSETYKSEESLSRRFHCGGFWASKKKAINEQDLDYFLQQAAKGDVKIFKTPWCTKEIRQLSEQTTINYMTLKKNLKFYNFTLEDDNSEYKTGCNVTSKHFEEKEHILYDRGKRLTYLHYMGVKNERLNKLCELESINLPFKKVIYKLGDKLFDWQISDIPYKDIFLYYHFLKPETR